MKTVGLDPSTCTGMAMVGDGEDRGKTVELPRERGFLRLQLIADDIAGTINVWEPEFVAIESYAFVRNIDAFVRLVEVGTAIRMALREQGFSWVDVPPTVLKKWTTGSGNAGKPEMALAVKTRWGFESPSYDIVDAYALAQMAQLGWQGILSVRGVKVGWDNPLTKSSR